MGSEMVCSVEFDGTRGEAKALLETDELIVRSPFRVRVKFNEMQDIAADGGQLRIRWGSHRLSLNLGRDAAKWAEKIRNPKPLAEKLGVRAGQKISVAGTLEPAFVDELKSRGADVSTGVRAESDLIFLAVASVRDLDRMAVIKSSLAPRGALWVVFPKGQTTVGEREVIDRGRAAALVDVKVARFSATHTAQKFVARKNGG